MVLLRELPHVEVAAAEPQRRLDRVPLVLEGGTGQVEVQAVLSGLLRGGRDEPEPDLRVVTRQQRAAGLPTIARPSTPAQNTARPAGSWASKLTATSRKGMPAR